MSKRLKRLKQLTKDGAGQSAKYPPIEGAEFIPHDPAKTLGRPPDPPAAVDEPIPGGLVHAISAESNWVAVDRDQFRAVLELWCGIYINSIFVQDRCADGKWGPLALSAMTKEQRDGHIDRWVQQGQVPVRSEEELPDDS
jgi:hypothetical protein